MVTTLTSASISSLPTEIREKILQYLPIDVHLAHVGLASKALFAPSIFHSIEFARSHVTTEIIRRASGNAAAYIVVPNYGFRKGGHHCPHLPLQYQMILFRKALESENYSHRAIKHSICTPLVGCLRIKSVLAHLLKDPTFDPSCNSSRILMWTFYEGKEVSMQLAFETFKLLFEDGRVDPTANNNEAFLLTCTYDHEEIVPLFLKNKNLDPSANSNEALKTACRLGNPNVTRCLLNDPRVDPTTVPDIIPSTLQFGINRRCIPVLLKDPRIDPGFMNNAALAVAAFHDYLPAATLLLADPRVDPMDNKGRALINSVLLGRLNVSRLLYASPRVNFGVYANKVIQNLCIEDEKDIDVLEMLLADERVDPRAGDSAVLIKMTENCMTSAVKLLLKDGRVDAAAKNNTALQTAASLNQIEIVRLLLEQDCVDPLDGGRLCALDLSLLCHNETVATILLEDRRVIERRKNFELTLDAFEMERMELLDFLFRQDGFMMGGGFFEMDDADWTPLFVYQNRTAVMTHCSKFLSGGKNYHEPSLDHVKVVETMFAVLHDTDVNPRTKFRSILTSWESLKIVCHTLL